MRDFWWCRQEIAEACHLDEEHVHICITTPGYRQITPRCGCESLCLQFFDLDPEALRRLPSCPPERIAGCMHDGQARQIVEFVRRTPESKIVVVNCEAGISRSPGVVLALRCLYGGDAHECFQKAYPNIHVASTLMRILQEHQA